MVAPHPPIAAPPSESPARKSRPARVAAIAHWRACRAQGRKSHLTEEA